MGATISITGKGRGKVMTDRGSAQAVVDLRNASRFVKTAHFIGKFAMHDRNDLSQPLRTSEPGRLRKTEVCETWFKIGRRDVKQKPTIGRNIKDQWSAKGPRARQTPEPSRQPSFPESGLAIFVRRR
jgi:hypothetical protein